MKSREVPRTQMTTRAAPARTTSLKPRVRATLRPYSSTPTILTCVLSYHVVLGLLWTGGRGRWSWNTLLWVCSEVRFVGAFEFRAAPGSRRIARLVKRGGAALPPSINQSIGLGPGSTDANFGSLSPPYASMNMNPILCFLFILSTYSSSMRGYLGVFLNTTSHYGTYGAMLLSA